MYWWQDILNEDTNKTGETLNIYLQVRNDNKLFKLQIT